MPNLPAWDFLRVSVKKLNAISIEKQIQKRSNLHIPFHSSYNRAGYMLIKKYICHHEGKNSMWLPHPALMIF